MNERKSALMFCCAHEIRHLNIFQLNKTSEYGFEPVFTNISQAHDEQWVRLQVSVNYHMTLDNMVLWMDGGGH